MYPIDLLKVSCHRCGAQSSALTPVPDADAGGQSLADGRVLWHLQCHDHHIESGGLQDTVARAVQCGAGRRFVPATTAAPLARSIRANGATGQGRRTQSTLLRTRQQNTPSVVMRVGRMSIIPLLLVRTCPTWRNFGILLTICSCQRSGGYHHQRCTHESL